MMNIIIAKIIIIVISIIVIFTIAIIKTTTIITAAPDPILALNRREETDRQYRTKNIEEGS